MRACCSASSRKKLTPPMQEVEGGKVGLQQVMRSLGLATALFVAFVGFANLLHALSCGFWCDMLLGSARR